MYGTFGREITEDTVIYGAYIWFWPTLNICYAKLRMCELAAFAAGSGGTQT
jgi:hypothetical protein